MSKRTCGNWEGSVKRARVALLGLKLLLSVDKVLVDFETVGEAACPPLIS